MYFRYLIILFDIFGGILLNFLVIFEKILDFVFSIVFVIMLSYFDRKKNYILVRLKLFNVVFVVNILLLIRISGVMNGIVFFLMFLVFVWNKVFV